MRIAKPSFLLIAAIVLGAAGRASAQTVGVLPPSGVNVAEGTLEAAQDVLRGDLAATGRYSAVIIVPGTIGKVELSAAEAAGRARGAGADLAVVLHLTRLGSSAQVRLTAYATATGAVVYSDRMAAATPDDLDRVLLRLTKGLVSGRPGSETAQLDTVTQTEATAPLKRGATHIFGVGVGVVVPTQGGDPIPGMDIFWLYDARSFLADISVGFHARESRGDFALGIGAYYPFGDGDFVPYLGGGARWAATHYGDDGQGSGIQLYAALGAIIGRLGSIQFRGQVEYFVNTFTTNSYDSINCSYSGCTYPPQTSGIGQGLGVSLGLGF